MDPLHFLVSRLALDWTSGGSLISVLIASCLVPFLYNLVSSEASALFYRLQARLSGWANRYEYVYIRNDSRNELYAFLSEFLNAKAEKAAASKSASIYSPLEDVVVFRLESGEAVTDTFEGVVMEWEYFQADKQESSEVPEYKNVYRLRMQKKDRELQRRYLLHVAKTVVKLRESKEERNLFTCSDPGYESYWDSYVFKHPSTFKSLALEAGLKERIMKDLDEFVESEEYYQSVGKPWKRGYLLYGPPGTGKSSLIAAIANYLTYDVYDLDLSSVRTNTELRRLLLQTKKKSVIVIEDIDCVYMTKLTARESKTGKKKAGLMKKRRKKVAEEENKEGVTLSGLLNFCDGLWSGSGSERVFIFTTNHIENLDEALLRRGRMDLLIHMSYCRFEALQTLVRNYLKVEEHELLAEVKRLVESVEVTPADIAEVLLSSRKDPTAALENLIALLNERVEQKVKGDGVAKDGKEESDEDPGDDVPEDEEEVEDEDEEELEALW